MLAEVGSERRLPVERRLEAERRRIVQRPGTLPACAPPTAHTVEETGIPMWLLVELIAKILLTRGQLKLTELSAHVKLTANVLHSVIDFLRTEKLCEITRRGSSGTDADLSYNLTDLGRVRAAEFMKNSAYAGPAPVPLDAYCAQVEAQSLEQIPILRDDVAQQLNDIVIDPGLMEQVGAAMNSQRAIFIHGPSGSGKTFLAEHLGMLLNGDIFVPHAILVAGDVIQMHDPMVHQPVAGLTSAATPFDQRTAHDQRWIRCARPVVLVGTELTLDMLDLKFDPAKHYYQAPLHMKSNNGLFIIDDLGRQRCTPLELLNRWNVPMERQIDYLSLQTGHKFPIPLRMKVVFAFSAQPDQLGDSTSLRRLGNRIVLGALTESQYERIFYQVCAQYDTPYCSDAFQYLLHAHHYKKNRPLLACYPSDILAQVRNLARYEDRPCRLDQRVLDWAWHNCFTES